jgi:hypothetical protein
VRLDEYTDDKGQEQNHEVFRDRADLSFIGLKFFVNAARQTCITIA